MLIFYAKKITRTKISNTLGRICANYLLIKNKKLKKSKVETYLKYCRLMSNLVFHIICTKITGLAELVCPKFQVYISQNYSYL